jgi:hypothetical protein
MSRSRSRSRRKSSGGRRKQTQNNHPKADMRVRSKAPKRRRTRKVPLGLAIGAAVVLALALYLTPASRMRIASVLDGSGTPVLQVDRNIVDLGDVALGKWAIASFALTNVGDGPLRFAKAPYVEAVAGC